MITQNNNMHMVNENPIIVGLDIGTTKIACIAGRKNQYGKLEILGLGKSDSSGVSQGMVLNVEECTRAINLALDECLGSNPSLTIKEVYVGIAGKHITSLQTQGERIVGNVEEEIRREDIEALIKDQYKTLIPNGDEIIDIIPQDFKVDSLTQLTMQDVIGMNGIKIGANFHIVMGNKNAIRNIRRSVTRTNLEVKELVLQPLASAAAVMCNEDLEAGVAIVDIGGGTTDLAVFHDGLLKHTAVISIAGTDITNDIRTGLGVLKTQAEQMKIQFGMAIAEQAKPNAFITIPPLRGQQPKEISQRNLAHIIESRMVEILDYVMYHLRQINLHDKLHGGIILTGGGSQLSGLVQLTEFKTGLSSRIGLPNEHLAAGYAKNLMNPMYATCIGLILRGYDNFQTNQLRYNSTNTFDQAYDAIPRTTATPPIELSADEILKNTFSQHENNVPQDSSQDGMVLTPEHNETFDFYRNHTHEQEIPEQKAVSKEDVKKRETLVSKVFKTVKHNINTFFDNISDDDKLDH
jgi:cell division protein FtsA